MNKSFLSVVIAVLMNLAGPGPAVSQDTSDQRYAQVAASVDQFVGQFIASSEPGGTVIVLKEECEGDVAHYLRYLIGIELWPKVSSFPFKQGSTQRYRVGQATGLSVISIVASRFYSLRQASIRVDSSWP